MSTDYFVKQNQVGSIALEWLSDTQQAEIFGTTSGGIFIHLEQAFQTIYLTNYPDFGPININAKESLPKYWDKGKKIQIIFDQQKILFKNGEHSIHLSDFMLWKNQTALPFYIEEEEFKSRIKKTSQQLYLIKGNHGFTSLLPFVHNPQYTIEDSHLSLVWQNMTALQKSVLQKDTRSFIKYSKTLIGYGRGLTPSGDDFLCGLIYCLKRKDHNSHYRDFLNQLQPEILNIATAQTTSISTSLLFASFLGQAHSRIENMTEALTSVEVPFSNQAMRMAGWGSSSGADTTLGIIIACQILFADLRLGKNE